MNCGWSDLAARCCAALEQPDQFLLLLEGIGQAAVA